MAEEDKRTFLRKLKTLFTDPLDDINREWEIERKLQYVALVGRNQPLNTRPAPIIDDQERVRVSLPGTVSLTETQATWSNEQTVTDAAGDVATTRAITGIEEIWGFALWYNADGNAASRTVQARLRQGFSSLPTGFATAANAVIWNSETATLTLSQEGGVFAMPRLSGKNTNGTIAVVNNTTSPNPFPLLGSSNLVFETNIGAGLAGDTYNLGLIVRRVA